MTARQRMLARSAPSLALIKAFAPGAGEMLIGCVSTEWRSGLFEGEKIVAEFALPDADARRRGFALAAFAAEAGAADIPLRGWMFTEIAAEVRGDKLIVEGIAVRD